MSKTGERLRTARMDRGLTQGELAKAIGVHFTWVSHVEGGRREPSVGRLMKLCDALGVSADYLIGRKNA